MYTIEFERADGSTFSVTATNFSFASTVWQTLADNPDYVHGKLTDINENEVIWSF